QDDDAKHDPSLLEVRSFAGCSSKRFEKPKRFKGGHRRTRLHRRERVTPGSPPASNVEFAVRYLRAAHAYMLISMPTGTSTILGDFVAHLESFFSTGYFSSL